MLKIEDLDSLSILKAIFDNSYNAIIITDAQLQYPGPHFLYVNKEFLKTTGYRFKELEGKSPRILQGKHSNKVILKELREKLNNGEHYSAKTINYKKNGTPYHVEWNISPIKDKDGKIVQYIAIQKDITDEAQHNELLQNIIDKQSDIVILTDGEKLVYANQKFKEFFQIYELDEFLAQFDCICDRFFEIKGFYYKKSKNESWIEELLKLSPEQRIVSILNDEHIPEAFQVEIERFKDDTSIVTFTNITCFISEKEKYKNKAYRDSLTKAYNREFLHANFTQIKQDACKHDFVLGVILLDIDHFKSINDSFGHNVGDEVLKNLVESISTNLRNEDILIRWGGEEFVILCEVRNLQELQIIAQKLRFYIENFDFGHGLQVTSSFGITLLQKTDSIESVVQRADKALYKAKTDGRNQVVTAS